MVTSKIFLDASHVLKSKNVMLSVLAVVCLPKMAFEKNKAVSLLSFVSLLSGENDSRKSANTGKLALFSVTSFL